MINVILAILVIASLVALASTVSHDGYGHRPAPRSHHDSFPTNPFV